MNWTGWNFIFINTMDLTGIINLLTISSVLSFNLDYEYAVVKQGPKDSYFGFSVLQHKEGSNNWILVGAPTGENKYLNCPRCDDKKSGTVYKCNATSPLLDCEDEVKFDEKPSRFNQESKTGEWLGVSLKGGGDGNSVLSCAHRYTSYGGGAFRLLEGTCHRVDPLFKPTVDEHNPCRRFNNAGDAGGGLQTYIRYGACMTGMGLAVKPKGQAPGDSLRLLFGSPGALTFRGKIFESEISNDGSVNSNWLPTHADMTKYANSLFGYTIAIGKFTGKTLEIAAGGPRHESFGKVIIYKDNLLKPLDIKQPYFSSDGKEIPTSYDKDEIEIASGFGIALCAIDVNKDGFDELVVGAPFTASNKSPNVGKVFVYGKSKSGELEVKQTFTGDNVEYASFGYAVANGGDLNLDGYPDLVIGAPHKDPGQGAVFVYQGTNEGFASTPQVIQASSVQSGLASAGALGLLGFGRSIAGGLDLDRNGYKDVLVGSYGSGHAVLLRARPVIIPLTSMTFTPSQIDTTNLHCDKSSQDGPKRTVCLELKFCHNITEASSITTTKNIKIKFKLTADAEMGNNPRVYIKDSNVHEFTATSSSVANACYDIKDIYLQFGPDGTIAEYPDVKFTVSYEIPYGDGTNFVKKPGKETAAVPSLDKYPILSRTYRDGKIMQASVDFAQLTFKRECTKCIPNLKITSPSSNYTLRPGSTDFPFNITIENLGVDPAYAVTLKFKSPKDLVIAQVAQVSERGQVGKQCLNFTCENIIPKLPKGEKRQFIIFLDSQKIKPENKYTLEVVVSSTNDEEKATLSDNTLKINFDTKVVADVELLAVKTNQQIAYTGTIKGEKAMRNLDEVGQTVNHKFAVRNNGPDPLPSANLTIYWPYETISGKHLLYLVDVQTSSRTTCEAVPTNVADIKKSGKAGALTANRKRRDATPASNQTVVDEIDPNIKTKESQQRNGIMLSCVKKSAKCITIKCQVKNIPSKDSEAITIRSRLWEPSLLIDYYGEVLTVASYGNVILGQNASYLSDPNPNNNHDELFTVINPVLVKPKKKIAVWIIALAVIAGIILLALLIFGLFKMGFFKRNRKHEYRAKSKEPEKPLMSN